jgi:hypothetical protein
VVRGVLSPDAQRHPLTRLRRKLYDRSWLGSVLQTMWRAYQQVTVQVAFGAPVQSNAGCASLVAQIIEAERLLMFQMSTRR